MGGSLPLQYGDNKMQAFPYPRESWLWPLTPRWLAIGTPLFQKRLTSQDSPGSQSPGMHFSAVERKGSSWGVSSVVLRARSLILAKQHGASIPRRDTMSRILLTNPNRKTPLFFSLTTSLKQRGKGIAKPREGRFQASLTPSFLLTLPT